MASKLVTKGVRNAGQLAFLRRFTSAVAFARTGINLPRTDVTTLDNGLRVASEDWDTPTASVSVFLDVGSRFETEKNNGVSHFIEHVAFKSTKQNIEAEAEKRGVRFGAMTSREMTAFTASCHRAHLPWVMQTLGEVVKNSTFDEDVVDKERNVILREMAEVESNYRAVVQDYMHASAYQGTPLSQTVLGPEENVLAMKAADLSNFAGGLYKAPRMIVSCAGGATHGEVTDLANKHFGDVSATYEQEIPSLVRCRFTGSEIRDRDDAMPLIHLMIGVEGPGWDSSDTIPLMIAQQLLGQWNNSDGGYCYTPLRLARGFATSDTVHSYEHFFHCYHDTSLWGIYMVSQRMEVDRYVEFVNGEWMRMCTNVTDFEVQRAKNALKSSMLLRLNGDTAAASEEIGRHILAYGRRIPVDEMIARINKVDGEELRKACMKYIYDRCPVVASIGPVEAVPDYNRMTRTN